MKLMLLRPCVILIPTILLHSSFLFSKTSIHSPFTFLPPPPSCPPSSLDVSIESRYARLFACRMEWRGSRDAMCSNLQWVAKDLVHRSSPTGRLRDANHHTYTNRSDGAKPIKWCKYKPIGRNQRKPIRRSCQILHWVKNPFFGPFWLQQVPSSWLNRGKPGSAYYALVVSSEYKNRSEKNEFWKRLWMDKIQTT